VHLTNDEENLLRMDFQVAKVRWTRLEPPSLPLECEVQVRYRARPTPATLTKTPDGGIKVLLHQPARAVAPGQAAVFYDGNHALGRGWIE
jgi:tRNA-specific 2-thiouridylase